MLTGSDNTAALVDEAEFVVKGCSAKGAVCVDGCASKVEAEGVEVGIC